MRRRSTADRGFSLLEMVVALTIISILAAILTPILRGYIERARYNAATNDARHIAAALLQFNMDTRMWPIYKSTNVTPLATTSNVFNVLEGPGEEPLVATTITDWSAVLADVSGTTSLEGTLNTNYLLLPTEGLVCWNGPYIELGPDPWGSRYLVTAANLRPRSPYAAYIISAGPNQLIETSFEQLHTSQVIAGGDDIVQRIQ